MFSQILKRETSLGSGKVISLLNQKGGVGKTTLVFNIAHALRTQGKKVLCLDMDPQANLTLLTGHEPDVFGTYQLLLNTVKELKMLHQNVVFEDVVKRGEIDLLPSHQYLSGFELSVAGIAGARQLILKKMIKDFRLKDHYDYILIDSPPTLGLLMVNIVCASDGILVPFMPDKFSQKGLEHFHYMVNDIKNMDIGVAPKILGYIPNLVDERRKATTYSLELIEQDLVSQARLFSPIVNRSQMAKALLDSKSVFHYQTKAYKELQSQFDEIASTITKEL